jgi:hypothetical protein
MYKKPTENAWGIIKRRVLVKKYISEMARLKMLFCPYVLAGKALPVIRD